MNVLNTSKILNCKRNKHNLKQEIKAKGYEKPNERHTEFVQRKVL